jgi:hypothetical protein
MTRVALIIIVYFLMTQDLGMGELYRSTPIHILRGWN